MRKSTLFISATLTVFLLAVMSGVVSAYHEIVISTAPMAQTESIGSVLSISQPVQLMPTSAVAPAVSPEQATELAMQLLNRIDVYSVVSTTYEEIAAYLVTFSSGDLVYISSTGEVLAITKLEPVVVAASGGRTGGSNNGGNGGEDHESDEEHEEHDDD